MNTYDEYYPRPLLKRDSFFSLNGEWTLNGQNITVPFAPEAELSGYKGDLKEMTYRKTFRLPDGFYHSNDKVILHFGAVDQVCDIVLNEEQIFHHEGGYLPFKIDITAYLKEENVLIVRAKDDLDFFYPYGKQCAEPHGMWYTPVSGIWQSVWIEAYDRRGIDSITIRTDMDRVYFHVESTSKTFTVKLGSNVQTFGDNNFKIKIGNPHHWSVDDPYLYRVKIYADNDIVETYFALRKTEVKNIGGIEYFFLNDKPLFINGLLDQGYFEKGIYTPSDVKEYENDILNIKKLGFNALRKHIKVEAEAFYYYCDLHGILVIQDMVNSGKYSFFRDTLLPTIGITKLNPPVSDQERYDFFIRHAKETIAHLKSHPSIIAYTIYNEGWGQQDASGTYEILKQEDPDRLFDTASGWFTAEKSDFDSYHIYFRNKVLKHGKKLLFLSECGGFIRDIEDHRSDKGSKWGYGKADSEKALTAKIIEMHDKMVIPSIRNGLSACIMTQISDVEGEINGIYTYDRKICKVNKKDILAANQKLQDIYVQSVNEQADSQSSI